MDVLARSQLTTDIFKTHEGNDAAVNKFMQSLLKPTGHQPSTSQVKANTFGRAGANDLLNIDELNCSSMKASP